MRLMNEKNQLRIDSLLLKVDNTLRIFLIKINIVYISNLIIFVVYNLIIFEYS